MKTSRWTIIFALIISLITSTASIVTAADAPFDDNQVPIENHAENGSLHIISDDTLEPEVVDPPSMLAPTTGTTFCSSADTEVCPGKDLWYVAHLPQCDTTTTTDCIVGVSATVTGQTESAGVFNRYFPNNGPQSFTGKPSIQLPSGRAPSVWKIAGAPHNEGDEYVVVARLRGDTRSRKKASFQLALTPVSLKTDADTSNTYQMPKWTEPGRLSGPASDRGLFRCAYWGENGACLLSRKFPANTTYTVTVRLAVEPAGWLHGRINTPKISFTKDGDNTLVKITATPVQVPAFQVAKQYSAFPTAVQRAFAVDGPYGPGGSRQPGGAERLDPSLRNAEYNITSYKDTGFTQLDTVTEVIADKAGWAPTMWRVRTLSDNEMSKAGKCLTDGDGVKGIVTTNATIYGSGPPLFNTKTKSLDYKVAAPHYTRTGEEFKGTYNLFMRSDVARCFYDFNKGPVKAAISVIKANGDPAPSTTSIIEEDGWLKLSASGFTHSAPTVTATLSQDPEPTTTTSPATTVPETTTTSAPAPVSTPTVATTPRLNAKVKKVIQSKTLLKASGLTLPKKAKMSLSIASKYKKKCVASGTSLRTLAVGTCVVKVTVTTATKKKTAQSVTITIKK